MGTSEIGYYTDRNGLTWQLSADEAAALGFTAPDAAPSTPEPAVPAGPPDDDAGTDDAAAADAGQ